MAAQENPGIRSHPPIVQRKKPRQVIRGGYECEFVQRPSGQTDCSICLLVLRSPHLATCCGHNFCKECIQRVQQDGKPCPLCNNEGFIVAYNREKDVSLKQLKVYCTHGMLGCDWTGALESLEEHLNVEPRIEKQLEGCAYVEVKCFNNGCGLVFQRHFLEEHQFKKCPQRYFSCEYCHEYESTYGDVTTNHWLKCPYYRVPCPNKCTESGLERQNLQRHLDQDCPLQEVECEFRYAGCEAKLPRKDMLEHLNKNVGHMTMLARRNQELTTKLLEKDEAIRRMMAENQRLVEENRREVEHNARKMEEARREIAKLSLNQQERLQCKDEQIERLVKQHYRDVEMLEQGKTEQIKSLVRDMVHRMEKQYPTKRDLEVGIAGLKQHQDATKRDLEKQLRSQERATKKDLETRVGGLEQKLDAVKRDLEKKVGDMPQRGRSNPRGRRHSRRGRGRPRQDSRPEREERSPRRSESRYGWDLQPRLGRYWYPQDGRSR